MNQDIIIYTKICTSCKKEKDLEEFHLESSKSKKRRAKCKVCQAKYIQKYKAENYEKITNKWRQASRKYIKGDKRRNKTLAQYGLTKADYNKMYDDQKGICKICGSNLTLCVDHCHTTGKVRGLL